MAFLRNMSDRLWSFVSPRKTQQRREKPFKVPQIPVKREREKLPRREKTPASASSDMSPQTRIRHWEISTPTMNGFFDSANLPPSPPRSLQRQYYDPENETLIEEIGDMNPAGETVWDANEDTIVADDGDYLVQKKKANDRELEIARRREQARNLRDAGWTDDAVYLFQKLGNRGSEALLPIGWYDDFEMLPDVLFTRATDEAYIKATYGSDFHAQKALSDVFDVGPRARDAILTKAPVRTAENQIHRGIYKYNSWAMKEDGGFATLWDNLSLFQVHTCPKNVSPKALELKATRRLGKLAARWRNAFRDRLTQNSLADQRPDDYDCLPNVPTLYGVLASHTIMAFVSYDVNAPNPCLRTIAMFDFGQEDYDVWNGLAIAIFIIHCRNKMIELEEFLPLTQSTTESDPDL